MKTFVFGIGGTGARVLRSLTLLLASGVECKSDIVPIIIDPDMNLISGYQSIILKIYPSNNSWITTI